jgi:hypothetical protein
MGSTTADWITAIATLVTGAAAIAALLGAVVTIVENRRDARRRAIFEYLHRIEELELSPAFGTMSAFMRGGIRPPRIKQRAWAAMAPATRIEMTKRWWHELLASSAQEDRELLARICAYPNTLEGLAAMYNAGLLDRRIVKSHVESQAKGYLAVADWWITMLRASSSANFKDTQVMIKDLEKRKKPRWYNGA